MRVQLEPVSHTYWLGEKNDAGSATLSAGIDNSVGFSADTMTKETVENVASIRVAKLTMKTKLLTLVAAAIMGGGVIKADHVTAENRIENYKKFGLSFFARYNSDKSGINDSGINGYLDPNYIRESQDGVTHATIDQNLTVQTEDDISGINRDFEKMQERSEVSRRHIRVVIPLVNIMQFGRTIREIFTTTDSTKKEELLRQAEGFLRDETYNVEFEGTQQKTSQEQEHTEHSDQQEYSADGHQHEQEQPQQEENSTGQTTTENTSGQPVSFTWLVTDIPKEDGTTEDVYIAATPSEEGNGTEVIKIPLARNVGMSAQEQAALCSAALGGVVVNSVIDAKLEELSEGDITAPKGVKVSQESVGVLRDAFLIANGHLAEQSTHWYTMSNEELAGMVKRGFSCVAEAIFDATVTAPLETSAEFWFGKDRYGNEVSWSKRVGDMTYLIVSGIVVGKIVGKTFSYTKSFLKKYGTKLAQRLRTAPSARPGFIEIPTGGGKVAAEKVAQTIEEKLDISVRSLTESKLQHEFKHANDFGILGNWNKANGELYKQAVKSHLQQSTNIYRSTYRGQCAYVYINKSTGIGAYVDLLGNYIGGWKFSPEQMNFHVTNGIKIK